MINCENLLRLRCWYRITDVKPNAHRSRGTGEAGKHSLFVPCQCKQIDQCVQTELTKHKRSTPSSQIHHHLFQTSKDYLKKRARRSLLVFTVVLKPIFFSLCFLGVLSMELIFTAPPLCQICLHCAWLGTFVASPVIFSIDSVKI